MNKIFTPIARIENNFKEKFGVPRQSGRAPSVLSKIVFEPKFRSPYWIRGMDSFSHLWLIFDFSLLKHDKVSALVRPPRLGGNQKVGVFASRSPFRPNGIGLSCVKIEKIVYSGENAPFIIVSGADLIDKTPIYDIKPYLPFADCILDAKGGYSENQINHKLSVVFLNNCNQVLPNNILDEITQCLSDDPRPAYQNDQRQYGMTYADFNVKFFVQDNTLFVTDVEKLKS